MKNLQFLSLLFLCSLVLLVRCSSDEDVDMIPPTVISISPNDGERDVLVTTSIVINFSEPVAPQSITSSSVTVEGSTGKVSGSFSVDGNVATFTPGSSLSYNVEYTVTATSSVTDVAGNALVNFSSGFTTEEAPDTEAPTVSSTSPATNEANVALNKDVVISFSEDIDPASVTAGNVSYTNVSSATSVSFVSRSVSGNQITMSVDGGLSVGTTYGISVRNIRDLAGNTMDESYSWQFSTEAASEALPELYTGRWYNVAGTWIYGIDSDENGAYIRTGNVQYYYDNSDVSLSGSIYRVNGTSASGATRSFWLREQADTNGNVVNISTTSSSSGFTQFGKVVGATVTGARAVNGIEFRKNGSTSWEEIENGSVTNTFTEYARDDWSVYMEKADGARIQIGCFRGIIRIQTVGTSQFSDLYDVAELYDD